MKIKILTFKFALLCLVVTFGQETLAFSAYNQLFLFAGSDGAESFTSASSSSFEAGIIDSVGVNAQIEEEGSLRDSDSNLCERTFGSSGAPNSISCWAGAAVSPLSDGCQYCAYGIAIAWWAGNTYEERLFQKKCKRSSPW